MPFGVPLCRRSPRVRQLSNAGKLQRSASGALLKILSICYSEKGLFSICSLRARSMVGSRVARTQAKSVIRRQVTVTSIKDRGVFFTISFGLRRAAGPVSVCSHVYERSRRYRALAFSTRVLGLIVRLRSSARLVTPG